MAFLARFLSNSHGFRPAPSSGIRRPSTQKSARVAAVAAVGSALALSGGMLPACSAATGMGDGSGGVPNLPSPSSLIFVPTETLLLEPGDMGDIAVQVEPPGFHSVSFSLMANPNDPAFDGFLEAATVVTDESGLARNVVQAPTSSAVFLVRASVSDELFATRTVSVSTEGFATLQAVPTYTGTRDVESWSAVASLGVSCSDLESWWQDGALEAEGDEDGVTLPGVPVGSDVALVVRAGQYVGGCVSVSGLDAGEVREVDVPITDRPLQLFGSALQLALDVEERTTAFVDLLGSAATRGASDYALGRGEDAEVLLADWAAAIADDAEREVFLERASEYAYGDVLRAHLPTATVLRDVVLSELVRAATQVDGAEVWTLVAEFDSAESTLVLSRAGGVPAAKSGFLGSSDLSVVREPNDRLVLGADLEFQATRWLGAIAEQAAEGPLDLLEEAAACAELSAALREAAGDEDIYPSCDDDCAVVSCREGLRIGWNRARTKAKDLTSLRIGVSGQVRIDEEARPTELRGDWVGSFDSSDLSVAGTVSPVSVSEDVP